MAILNNSENEVIEILNLMGIDCEELNSKIEAYLRLKIKSPTIKKKLLSLSKSSKRMLSVSEIELDKLGMMVISEIHLMLAILKDKELDGTKVLKNQGIEYKNFKNTLLEIKKEINMSITDDYGDMEKIRGKKGGEKSETPILDNFGRDITEIAAKGGIDPIIGRGEEIERVSQILSRRKKNNPILNW